MILKSQITPSVRIKILTAMGPIAWLALMLSIFLGRLENPNLNFVTGFLVGLAIVGNLAYIFVITRHLRENRGRND